MYIPVSSSIFTRSFAVVLGLILHFSHQSTFIFRRHAWFHGVYTIVCTDEWGTFGHLEIAPKDEPDFWRSTFSFLRSRLIYLDFPMMSSKEALSLKVCLEIHPQVHLNWLKWCQLAYQKLLKPWHHFLEFSKLFKGTLKLMYVNFWPTGIVIQCIISEIISL